MRESLLLRRKRDPDWQTLINSTELNTDLPEKRFCIFEHGVGNYLYDKSQRNPFGLGSDDYLLVFRSVAGLCANYFYF